MTFFLLKQKMQKLLKEILKDFKVLKFHWAFTGFFLSFLHFSTLIRLKGWWKDIDDPVLRFSISSIYFNFTPLLRILYCVTVISWFWQICYHFVYTTHKLYPFGILKTQEKSLGEKHAWCNLPRSKPTNFFAFFQLSCGYYYP